MGICFVTASGQVYEVGVEPSGDAFERLGTEHPAIKIRLLENLARGLSRKLRKANVELSVSE